MLKVYQKLEKVELSSEVNTFLVKIRISNEKYWLSTFTKDLSKLGAAR